jgi:hypothetical protein
MMNRVTPGFFAAAVAAAGLLHIMFVAGLAFRVVPLAEPAQPALVYLELVGEDEVGLVPTADAATTAAVPRAVARAEPAGDIEPLLAAPPPPTPAPLSELAVQNPLTHKPPADRADLSEPPSPPSRSDVPAIAEADAPTVPRVPAPARRSPEPDRAAAPDRVAAGSLDELSRRSAPVAPQPTAAPAEPGFFEEIRRFVAPQISEAMARHLAPPMARAATVAEPDRAVTPDRFTAPRITEAGPRPVPRSPRPVAAPRQPVSAASPERAVPPAPVVEVAPQTVAGTTRLSPPMAPTPEGVSPPRRVAVLAIDEARRQSNPVSDRPVGGVPEPSVVTTPRRAAAPDIAEIGAQAVPGAPLGPTTPSEPPALAAPGRPPHPMVADLAAQMLPRAVTAPEPARPPDVMTVPARPDRRMVAAPPAAAAARPVARQSPPPTVAPVADIAARGGDAAPPDVAGWLLDRAERYAVESRERAPERLDPIDQLLADAGETARVDMVLSATEIDNIRGQIRGNWSLPAGVHDRRDLSRLVVTLRLQLQPDGRVTHVTVIDRARMDTDPLFRAVAESTVRAVRRTRLIRGLAPEKYLLWRDMRINFDPRDVAPRDLG